MVKAVFPLFLKNALRTNSHCKALNGPKSDQICGSVWFGLVLVKAEHLYANMKHQFYRYFSITFSRSQGTRGETVFRTICTYASQI